MHCGCVDIFFVVKVQIFLDFMQVNMGNGVITVENTGNFLEGRALSFDVEEPNENQFNAIPEGIEQHEVPVMRQLVPGNLVCLTITFDVSKMMF